MPRVSYTRVLLYVFSRVLLVLALAIPTFLVLLVMSAAGPSASKGMFALVVALALGGLAWAFLPLIQAGPRSGLLFAALWLGLAIWHLVFSGDGARGETATAWLLASLFLGFKLKSRPPGYFPQSWRDAAALTSSSNDA
jgi:hypothetical protein